MFARSGCLAHHHTNYGTAKNFGMQLAFTNPTVLRCFEATSYRHGSDYQWYALDQWKYLSSFVREFNVSPKNGSLFFLPPIFWIKKKKTCAIGKTGYLNMYIMPRVSSLASLNLGWCIFSVTNFQGITLNDP